MLGALIGDIVGSVYEWHNHKSKDFPLFQPDCRMTDDSVMTAAVASAAFCAVSDMRGLQRGGGDAPPGPAAPPAGLRPPV